MISSSPEISEMNAIFFPSGDQCGSRSCAPGVLVKLRVIPGPAGTVKSSPLALKQTRLPSGEGVPDATLSATESNPVRAVAKSSLSSIGIFAYLSVSRSSFQMNPACSNAIALSPRDGNLTSKSAKVVTCLTALVARLST